MENKLRIQPEKENVERVKPKKESASKGNSIFSGIERRLKLETYFEEGFPVQYLPKILFVLALSLLYIGNTHHAREDCSRDQSRTK
ncbi:MAG: FtsL-like putative cell division protein [Bacteroidota bacterium]